MPTFGELFTAMNQAEMVAVFGFIPHQEIPKTMQGLSGGLLMLAAIEKGYV